MSACLLPMRVQTHLHAAAAAKQQACDVQPSMLLVMIYMTCIMYIYGARIWCTYMKYTYYRVIQNYKHTTEMLLVLTRAHACS